MNFKNLFNPLLGLFVILTLTSCNQEKDTSKVNKLVEEVPLAHGMKALLKRP